MSRAIMLIVDDIELNREALAASFSSQFAIAYASDGDEACAYVAAHSEEIAIILLDIIMPKMDGIAFLKWISHSDYRRIPVVAVTAEPNYQIEALENGAWDFIAKPMEQSVLRARVNNVLGRYSFLREKELTEVLKAANLNLQTAKQQMDHLVNSIPGGIAIYRLSDRFETLYFSDGVAELSGHTREEYREWIGDDASRAMFQSDKTRLMGAAMEMLRNGKPIDEIYRIYHKDGHLVWVRLNAMPMEKKPDGIIVYAVFQSISPQTKLYQSVLDETQTAIYACDVDTYEILYFNQQMAAFAGVESTSVTGKKCYEYLFHRDTPCTFCRIGQMQRNKMLEREFVYPINQRTYHMKGKLIDWNKITAHIEYIQDITATKAAEAKNAALLAQLASIMDNVPGALCLYKMQNGVLEPVIHNQAFYHVLGYSQENAESVNHSTSFLNVHPDDVQGLQAAVSDALAQLKPISYTYRFYHDRKGRYIWLRLNAKVMARSGGIKMAYCVYTDVTEEKEAVQVAIAAKERSEEQYRRQMQAIDSVTDAGLIAKGYCNLTQNKMISYTGDSRVVKDFAAAGTFDAALAMLVAHAIPPQKEKELLQAFDRKTLLQNFAHGKTETVVEHQWEISAGVTVWISTVCRTALEPETDDVVGFIYTYDITEQKTSQEMIDTVVKLNYDYLALLNCRTNEYLVYANTSSAKTPLPPFYSSGYEDEVERYARAYLAPEDIETNIHDMSIANIREQLKHSDSFVSYAAIKNADGTMSHKKLQFSYLDRLNEKVLITRIDITDIYEKEQNRLKELLDATMAAEQANHAKTDFLSRMSHDIRTPLNAVIGLSGLGETSDSIEEMREYLHQIGASGEYLLAIINDVLDMSKIESKTMVLNPTVVFYPHLYRKPSPLLCRPSFPKT